MDSALWSILFVGAYLMGSIPFALLLGWCKGVDLRQHGSKNVGATNCGRILGRRYGVLCFMLDFLKGFAPVFATGWGAGLLSHEGIEAREAGLWLAVAAGPVLGHIFPIWLKFKGGKGVATGFGVVLAVWPFMTLPALAALATWGLMAALLRYSSVASVIASVSMLPYFVLLAKFRGWPFESIWPFVIFLIGVVSLIVVRHKSNFQRLRAGTESKLGSRDPSL
ncbi:MAG: glycerol-3-phosphate 1-O-acyltransferase PlsY [Phycisphaeraceae bacterium]|nr:glycerol-3-phosphate 1-O-acyltransferase PlsY [Phycisphaeraceae bacterium]